MLSSVIPELNSIKSCIELWHNIFVTVVNLYPQSNGKRGKWCWRLEEGGLKVNIDGCIKHVICSFFFLLIFLIVLLSFPLKRGVNPKFMILIDRCNFWIFTVTLLARKWVTNFIFVSYFTENADVLKKKNHKKHFFGSTFLWQANKNHFDIKKKMSKLLEYHVRTHV